MTAPIRTFDTGATRDLDVSKYDYEGFLSPLVLERYAEYMHANRRMADGSLRDGDNWQKGIPPTAYMKSGYRHFIDWWKEHRGIRTREGLELALCGLLFNAMGYLHETLKVKAQLERELYEPDEIVETLAHAYTAPMPPYATLDSDEGMGLTAGEAFAGPVESLGRAE